MIVDFFFNHSLLNVLSFLPVLRKTEKRVKMRSFWHHVVVWKRVFHLLIVWLPLEVATLLLSKFIHSVKSNYKQDFDFVMHDTSLKPSDYEDSIYSLAYVKQCFRSRYLDISKEAFLGCRAPNPKVLSLNDCAERSLFEFQSKDRPLVLSFGSCT